MLVFHSPRGCLSRDPCATMVRALLHFSQDIVVQLGRDTTVMHIRHMRPSATPGGEALTTNLAAKWLQHLVGEIPWEDGPATPILRDHMAADATREQSALS